MPTALVTGCSRATGFGQLTAKALAQSGFHVFASLRGKDRASDLQTWAEENGYIAEGPGAEKTGCPG